MKNNFQRIVAAEARERQRADCAALPLLATFMPFFEPMLLFHDQRLWRLNPFSSRAIGGPPLTLRRCALLSAARFWRASLTLPARMSKRLSRSPHGLRLRCARSRALRSRKPYAGSPIPF